jgi:hypothetical protein
MKSFDTPYKPFSKKGYTFKKINNTADSIKIHTVRQRKNNFYEKCKV